MSFTCHIFADSKVDKNLLTDLIGRLEESYTVINLKVSTDVHTVNPTNRCFDKTRKQYNASKLVDLCAEEAEKKKLFETPENVALYLIKDDAFSGDLNFVFGLAKRQKSACMVSLYRLVEEDDDEDLPFKISVHELGHVFGLDHCQGSCVMIFSNSLDEAKESSEKFCDKCKTKLAEKL